VRKQSVGLLRPWSGKRQFSLCGHFSGKFSVRSLMVPGWLLRGFQLPRIPKPALSEGTVSGAYFAAQTKFQTPFDSYISSQIHRIGHFTAVGGKSPKLVKRYVKCKVAFW